MTNKKRIITVMLVTALIFVVLCSALFIIHGSEHDCIGEGCVICNCINLIEGLQRLIALASAAFMFAAIPLLTVLFYAFSLENSKRENTPIKLKVKILN